MSKEFLDWSTVAGSGGGWEMLGNSVRKGISFDAYEDVTQFEARVLTDAYPLNDAQAAVFNAEGAAELILALSSSAASVSRGTKWIVKARIIGPKSPHQFIPDPCDAKFLEYPEKALPYVMMHTSFITTDDSQGDLTYLNQGDTIQVELTRNDFSFNLDFGKIVKRTATAAQNTVGRLQTIGPKSNRCQSLQSLFGSEAQLGLLGPNVSPSMSVENEAIAQHFERDLKAAIESANLPFYVTDRSRTVAVQVERIKYMYNRVGEAELLSTYSRGKLGAKMVAAIKSGDDALLRNLAKNSSSHLKGLAIDLRSNHYDKTSSDGAQINRVLAIIRQLGGKINLEPTSTTCWSTRGAAASQQGATTARVSPNKPGKGKCVNEHIHISIPADYGGAVSQSGLVAGDTTGATAADTPLVFASAANIP